MHFSCTKRGFWVELLFGISASHSRLQAIKVGVFREKLQRGLSKLNPSCPQDPLGKNDFRKIHQFLFSGLSPKTVWKFGNFFSAVLPKLASIIAEESSDGKKKDFKSKKLVPFYFWLWVVDFQAGGRKNRNCLQSCILRVQRKLLFENRFWEKKISLFSDFLQ